MYSIGRLRLGGIYSVEDCKGFQIINFPSAPGFTPPIHAWAMFMRRRRMSVLLIFASKLLTSVASLD